MNEMLRAVLEDTYHRVEAPRSLIGYEVPDEIAKWAEEKGLLVQTSDFAPRGQVFITGAIPVPWEFRP